jgi:hypothetical protein
VTVSDADAEFNLAMFQKYPNWYDHLDSVDRAMREANRVYLARISAGWVPDEDTWLAPHPDTGELITASEWEYEHGLPLPEDQ